MIFGKVWASFRPRSTSSPISSGRPTRSPRCSTSTTMAVAQLKDGREGLEQYRALVERVGRQVATDKASTSEPGSQDQGLSCSRRPRTAPPSSPWNCRRPSKTWPRTKAQLKMHEEAYNNNLTKIKHASGKLAEVREKIQKYDAELKMSRAEAEMAKLAQDFNFDVTTDFGQIEQVIQDKIGLNRAKVRVAADLSGEGVDDIKQRAGDGEGDGATRRCNDFEVQMGTGHSRDGQGRAGSRQGTRSPLRRRSSRSRDIPGERSRISPVKPATGAERTCSPVYEAPRARTAESLRSRELPAWYPAWARELARPVFLRHHLPVRPARQRPRPDPLPRRRRRLLQPARVPGHAGVRLVGPGAALRPGPRSAPAGRRRRRQRLASGMVRVPDGSRWAKPAPGRATPRPCSWAGRLIERTLLEEDPTRRKSVAIVFDYAAIPGAGRRPRLAGARPGHQPGPLPELGPEPATSSGSTWSSASRRPARRGQRPPGAKPARRRHRGPAARPATSASASASRPARGRLRPA